MIWYLLYPFRGTTEPPILSRNHPIRRAFFTHGTNVTAHWLLSILLSVAIFVTVCYPFISLYQNPSSGFFKFPHHEWMSARPFGGNQSTTADVVIRQVWVHGNYMGVLDSNLLIESLGIQNAVLYGTFPGNQQSQDRNSFPDRNIEGRSKSWAFHSPLIYWNCSKTAMENDKDLMTTISVQSNRRSNFNLTLRPSSVFAGKSFINTKLVAADALVLTLFDTSASSHNTLLWGERLSNLAALHSDRWSFYPEPGRMTHSKLFKFQYKPISTGDDLILIALYVVMIGYVFINLRKAPRAVKSPLGLLLTVLLEMTVSIIASFTICAVLRVDLARIPSEAYPLVVLGIGPDNMFRLMNAVLAYPPQMPTTVRIANALGDVGHLSLAATGQNLAIVWLLHKVVSPGVQAFCTFAAAALIFDFCFHLIFFVAVLNVDVRRVELQDSIERVDSLTKTKSSTRLKRYWTDAFLSGRLPVSSRLAFPAVSICFILGLNLQFSDSESLIRLIINTLSVLGGQLTQSLPDSVPAFAAPINQARTPQTWLRLQNYQTAEEVIKLVKPTAHTIVARIYDPLAIVLKGSDRGGIQSGSQAFILLRETLRKHLYPFLLALGFCVGVTVLLMQYLLWVEILEEEDHALPTKAVFTVKRLPQCHQLDVFRLAISGKGDMIAADYNKQSIFYGFNSASQTWSLTLLAISGLPVNFWPNSCLTMDISGQVAALANNEGWIAIWDVNGKRFTQYTHHEHWHGRPILFELVAFDIYSPDTLALIIVTTNGTLTIHNLKDKSSTIKLALGDPSIVHACLIRSGRRLYAYVITQTGNVLTVDLSSDHLDILPLFALDSRLLSDQSGQVRWLAISASLEVVVVIRKDHVDVVNTKTRLLIHRMLLPQFAPKSLRILHSNPRTCPTCQSVAVHSFSVAYTDPITKSIIMRTYSAVTGDYSSLICFRPATNTNSSTCSGLESASVAEHRVENPGQWETTNDQAIVGIRHPLLSNTGNGSSIKHHQYTSIRTSPASSTAVALPSQRFSILTPRRLRQSSKSSLPNANAQWEVYTLSAAGIFSILPLQSLPGDLFVHKTGPISRIGKRSLVFVLGNVIRVVTVGSERIEEDPGIRRTDSPGTGRTRRKVVR